jgi:hypothetical protein
MGIDFLHFHSGQQAVGTANPAAIGTFFVPRAHALDKNGAPSLFDYGFFSKYQIV